MSRAPSSHDALPTVPAYRLFGRGYGELPLLLHDLSARLGPVIRFPRATGGSVYFFNEPAAIEEVLVAKNTSFKRTRQNQRLRQILGAGLLTTQEPEHLRHRRLVQPVFHRKRLDEYARVMGEKTAARVAAWRDGEPIVVDDETNRLALEIVAETLFGADLGRDMDTISAALDAAMAMVPIWMVPFSELLDRLPLPPHVKFRSGKARLDAVVLRLIRERRAENVDRGDLLSMLLAARDDAGAGFDDAQVHDEALTILLAGHETTANALAWAFYLLQRNDGVRERLERHVDDVLAGRLATIDDVPRLDFVRAVFAEAMRLYPPAWTISREALGPVTIGGIALRRGETVMLSQYVTHRDPRFWTAPERFDPERFLRDEPAQKFAFFPFGGGSRMCIGDSFAWTEGIIALATIVQRVRLDKDRDEDVRTLARVTLRPRSAIHARVRLRRSLVPRSTIAYANADTPGEPRP